LKQEIKDNDSNYKESLVEIDDNIEKDTLKIQYIYEKKIIQEKELLEKVKLENIDMKNQYNEIIKEINFHKQNLANVSNEEKKLQNIIHNLENDIENVKQEVRVIYIYNIIFVYKYLLIINYFIYIYIFIYIYLHFILINDFLYIFICLYDYMFIPR